MIASVIEDAAKAGYAAYFRDRPGRRFSTDPAQLRWLYVTARVLNGEVTTSEDLHNAYWAGFDPRLVIAWGDLPMRRRLLWRATLEAIQRHMTEAPQRPAAVLDLTRTVPFRERLLERRDERRSA